MPERQWPHLKAVLFDFDGTLTDYVRADLQALETLRAAACPHVEADLFAERAVEGIMAFHERVASGRADPLRMDRERLEHTLTAFGVPWSEAYLMTYTRALLAATVPAPGAHALLSGLRGRFRLGLLTNAYDGAAQRERLRASGLHDHFEVVVVAGETGALKPDPRPFQMVLRALMVEPGEALYVGDSPTHDVEGALAAGMPCVLVGGGRHPRAALRVPDLTHLLQRWC